MRGESLVSSSVDITMTVLLMFMSVSVVCVLMYKTCVHTRVRREKNIIWRIIDANERVRMTSDGVVVVEWLVNGWMGDEGER